MAHTQSQTISLLGLFGHVPCLEIERGASFPQFVWKTLRTSTSQNWGKERLGELSPLKTSYPQSCSQGFARVLQGVVPQSTDSTTITTLFKIYC